MNAETKNDATDLITIPHKDDVPALFATENGIKDLVAAIKKQALSFAPDTSTAKGRAEIKSVAARVSRSKTLIDEVGKDQNAERLALNKLVNEQRNYAKEELDALRDEIKKPVVEWEDKENERVRLHLVNMDTFDPDRASVNDDSATIQGVIDSINNMVVDETWEEYEADAKAAKAAAIVKLNADLAGAMVREKQAQELEELRAEKAKREAEDAARAEKEAAEKARQEHEQRVAEQAKAAAAEAEAKAKADAEAAEARHKAELAAAAKREEQAAAAERDRIAAVQQAEADRQAALAADKKHRQKIRSEIVTAITKAKPGNWEELVDMLIVGEIPHVKVTM